MEVYTHAPTSSSPLPEVTSLPNARLLREAGWRAVPGGVLAPDGQRLDDRDLVALLPDGSRSMDLRDGLLCLGTWIRQSLQDAERRLAR